MDTVVCPRCHGALTVAPAAARCGDCGAAYPSLPGIGPVLLPAGADEAVRSALSWLADEVAKLDRRIDELGADRWRPARWDTTRCDLIEGLSRNRKIYTRLRDMILAGTDARDEPLEATRAGRSAAYNDFSHYLERDWSDQAHSGRASRRLARLLVASLRKADARFDSALVLGAGLSRLAVELAPSFSTLCALDNSVVAAAMLKLLSDGFPFCHENFSNAIKAEAQVRTVRHRLTGRARRTASSASFTHMVADAAVAPFRSASSDVVFSVYFTDVLGLDVILPEVRRMLKPGGMFVHYGPLHYHFAERRRMYPVAFLRQIVEQLGFEIVEDRFVRSVSGGVGSELVSRVYSNWLLVAKAPPRLGSLTTG